MLIIDLSLIHLNIITQRKKIIAMVRCTRKRTFLRCFSSRSSLFFKPKISIQKDDVNAVNAPSALGNNAEIRPIIKMIETNDGKYCNATVGKRSSPFIAILLVDAKR